MLNTKQKKQLYNKIMYEISDIVTKEINEKYGVAFYNDSIYNECISNISDLIISNIKMLNKNKYNSYFIISDYIQDKKIPMYKITYDLSKLTWINTLNIYITKEHINSNYNDSFVLDETETYEWIFDNNTYKLSCKKVNFDILLKDSNNKIQNHYYVKNGKIEYASIILSMSEFIYNKTELEFILKHEIGHIYDVFINNTTTPNMNSDLLPLSVYGSSNNYNQQINYLLNLTVDNKLKIQFIKNLKTSDLISDLFINSIYLFNSSELRQRLHNFQYDIKNPKFNTNRNFVRSEKSIVKELSKRSDTYALYYSYYILFDLLIKCTPDNVKLQFSLNDIKDIYCDRPNNASNKKPYKTKFMNNKGYYDTNSFNKFINYYKDKIYNIFLHNATDMSQDLLKF